MKKSLQANFDGILEVLRASGFAVSEGRGGVLVTKDGAGAVLKAGAGGAEFVVRPGAVVKGEVARLLDRGYQKFLEAGHYELPATAGQLKAIHDFSEGLKELAGGTSLYNESLGTTSDRYVYDRVKGRDEGAAKGGRPWDSAGGH